MRKKRKDLIAGPCRAVEHIDILPVGQELGHFFSPVHIASQSHRTVDLVVCGRNLVKHLPDLMARGFVDLFGHSCARKDFYELALTLSKILPYEQYIL